VANYVTVVQDRPIMSAEYCMPVPVFQFWPKLTTLQLGLSGIAGIITVVSSLTYSTIIVNLYKDASAAAECNIVAPVTIHINNNN